MKLGKTTWWILIIGIFAILLVAAGVAYGRQMTKQSQLRSDINQGQQDFIKYTEQKRNLETSLSQAQSRIASAQNEFRQYTESTEINEALFEAADDANVTIITLSSSIPEDEELNGTTYRVFSLRIIAQGEVAALLNFSRKVSDRFSAAAVTSVAMNVPEAEEEEATIYLQVKIYVYGE